MELHELPLSSSLQLEPATGGHTERVLGVRGQTIARTAAAHHREVLSRSLGQESAQLTVIALDVLQVDFDLLLVLQQGVPAAQIPCVEQP